MLVVGSTFVAFSAAIITGTRRYNTVLARIWGTISTVAVLLIVQNMSMGWRDRLGRIARVGSTAATLPLLMMRCCLIVSE